jgi:outer membrane protein OmpU
LGDDDGAADELFVYAPVVGNGQIDEDWFDFAGPGIDTDDLLSPTDTADATKITYLSPVLGGLQAGVSYTPQSNDEDQSVVGFKAVDPDADENLYKDLVEAGISYTREFAGVSLVLNRVQFETHRFQFRSSPSGRLWKVGTTDFKLDAV